MSPHYSLTKATELFLKYYPGHQDSVSPLVNKYNAHKMRHSLGVVETGRNLLIKIQERLPVSQELSNRSEMTFFFHDIARFGQNDGQKILPEQIYEHGEKGYEIVKKEGLNSPICLAIKYHNKRDIEALFHESEYLSLCPDDQQKTVFLAQIVRDADKLQNMIFSLFYADGLSQLSPELLEGDPSPEVIQDLKAGITVDRKRIVTKADYILSHMSWKFDLYFPESLEMLEYYGYFEKTFKELTKLPHVSQERLEKVREIVFF